MTGNPDEQIKGQLNKKIKVNQVQFPKDSSWRQFKFFVRQKHLFRHLADRYRWYQNPKKAKVHPRFPLHVDLELASVCQMKCPFCYTISDEFKEKVPRSFMPFETVKKAIDECVKHGVYSIRLSWRGEPLMHPKFVQIMDYLAENKIPNVSFITNGMALNRKKIEAMIRADVKYFNVSIDGHGEQYNKLRAPQTWEQVLGKLKLVQDIKKEFKSKTPLVRVCSVWPAISDDPKPWEEALEPLTDKIVVNPFLDFGNPRPLNLDFVCQYLWQRIIITIDGDILPCPGDVHGTLALGNLDDMSISEAWNGEVIQHLRNKHSCGKRTDVETCKKCHHGWEWDKDKLAKEKTWLGEKEIFE